MNMKVCFIQLYIRRYVHRVAFLLVMTTVLTSCFQPGLHSGTYVEETEEVKGIPNFYQVSAELYRGGQPAKEGWDHLKEIGIKTVLCLRTFSHNRKQVERRAMQYRHISFKHLHPENEDVRRFFQIVTDPNQQPVFVYCHSGIDRTGMMAAAYRIVLQGWSKDRALKEMKELGHWGLWDPLKTYIQNMDVQKWRSAVTNRNSGTASLTASRSTGANEEQIHNQKSSVSNNLSD